MERLRKPNSLTFGFAVVSSLYWLNLMMHITYAATYLQAVGYSNTTTGIVLAIGNLAAALIGPKLVSISNHGRIKPLALGLMCLAVEALCDLALLLLGRSCTCFTIAYTVLIALCFPFNSISMELYSESLRRGATIDYGICRGSASLVYFLVMLLVSVIVSRFPISVVSVMALIIIAVQVVAFIWFASRVASLAAQNVNSAPSSSSDASEAAGEKPLSVSGFISRYRTYCLMLAGFAVTCVGFRVGCSFLINIVKDVGGDVSRFSLVTALATLTELPVMFLYSRLSRKFGHGVLLGISLAAYVLKIMVFALARSMTLVVVSQLLQGASYALHWAAIVPFTDREIDPVNAAMGQSLAFSVNSVSCFLSGIIGGVLLDAFSVSQTMWIAAGICLLGALIAIPCLVKLGCKRAA